MVKLIQHKLNTYPKETKVGSSQGLDGRTLFGTPTRQTNGRGLEVPFKPPP